MLTNWLVTRTDCFAAGVSQRSIADWAGFWYTADFSLFNPTWFKGAVVWFRDGGISRPDSASLPRAPGLRAEGLDLHHPARPGWAWRGICLDGRRG